MAPEVPAVETSPDGACTPSGLHSLAFPIAVTAVFLAVAGFTTSHHEMWRDEMGAWMLARDSASPLELLRNIRYEGHPSLWFLLLWPLTRLTHDPVAMQVANLALAAAAVFLLARHLPAPRSLRALAAFGYFPLYEYGSIARNYALALLALVAFCVLFPRRRRSPLLVGAALALAAHTVLHATVLALAATLALAAEAAADDPGPERRRRAWAGIGLAVVGIALAAWQMNPPPDGAYAPGWRVHFDPVRARDVLAHVVDAYAPVPRPGPGYWNMGIIGLTGLPAGVAAACALALVAWSALGLSRRPWVAAFYLAGTLGLLVFFYSKFDGLMRHHGFLFVCLGASLWLARTVPAKWSWRPAVLAERSFALLVPLLLAAQLAGAAVAVAEDYALEFSAARSTAAMMRGAGVDALPMVGDRDYAAMPVLGYLQKDRAYYPALRAFGSFILWNEARLAPFSLWDEALRLQRSLGTPITVVQSTSSLQTSPAPWAAGLRTIGCRQSQVVDDESFCVFVLGPQGAR